MKRHFQTLTIFLFLTTLILLFTAVHARILRHAQYDAANLPPLRDPFSMPTETKYPTAIPFHTTTPTVTSAVLAVPLGEQIKQNSTVVAALLIAFSVLLAGIIGFGKKKE